MIMILRNTARYSCTLRGNSSRLFSISEQSWTFKESMGARNRGGRGLSYRPARLHRLAEFISLESVPGPHTRLKIRALYHIIVNFCLIHTVKLYYFHFKPTSFLIGRYL
jgi:hypothetical protein